MTATSMAIVLGEDHRELGDAHVVDVAPGLALGLSAGRLPKPYASVDPNEDAALGAVTPEAVVAVVADGHHGFDAARAAVVSIHDHLARRPDETPTVAGLMAIAAAGIVAVVGGLEGRRSTSETALTVAVVRGGRVEVGTRGDTTAVLLGGRRPQVLADATEFLGAAHEPPRLRTHAARFGAEHTLVLMTDGAYGFLGRRWPDQVGKITRRRTAHRAAAGVIDAAFAAGAGDNVAVAVLTGPG